MTDREVTDDQIRVELKRMLADEKRRILAEFDRAEREFEKDPEIPTDARDALLARFYANISEGRERLERTMAMFADFIDRRESVTS